VVGCAAGEIDKKWKIRNSYVLVFQQYQDAIKQYKAGKPVDFDELPCPPGKLSLFCITMCFSVTPMKHD